MAAFHFVFSHYTDIIKKQRPLSWCVLFQIEPVIKDCLGAKEESCTEDDLAQDQRGAGEQYTAEAPVEARGIDHKERKVLQEAESVAADDVEDDRENDVDPDVGEDRVSDTVLPGEVPDGDGQIDVQGLRQAADQKENDSLHYKTEGSR